MAVVRIAEREANTCAIVMIVPPTLFSEPIALVLADQTKAGYLGTQVFTGMLGIETCRNTVR